MSDIINVQRKKRQWGRSPRMQRLQKIQLSWLPSRYHPTCMTTNISTAGFIPMEGGSVDSLPFTLTPISLAQNTFRVECTYGKWYVHLEDLEKKIIRTQAVTVCYVSPMRWSDALKVNTLLQLFSSMAIRRLKKILPKRFSNSRGSSTTRNSDIEDLRSTNAIIPATQSNDTGPGNYIDHALFMIWTLFAQFNLQQSFHPVSRRWKIIQVSRSVMPHVIRILKTVVYNADPSHIVEIGDGRTLSQSSEKQQYWMLLSAFQPQRRHSWLNTLPMIPSRTRKQRRSFEQLGMVSSTCLRASRGASMELHSRRP